MYVIGIDPGVGMTGYRLGIKSKPETVLDFLAISCPPCKTHNLVRVKEFATTIMAAIWESDNIRSIAAAKEELQWVIETPIYNSNPYNFELQWRLVHELETQIATLCKRLSVPWTLREVNNKTSKKLATGDGAAGKPAIVEASPFHKMIATVEVKEALADAWAHSLAGYTDHGTEIIWKKVGVKVHARSK